MINIILPLFKYLKKYLRSAATDSSIPDKSVLIIIALLLNFKTCFVSEKLRKRRFYGALLFWYQNKPLRPVRTCASIYIRSLESIENTRARIFYFVSPD